MTDTAWKNFPWEQRLHEFQSNLDAARDAREQALVARKQLGEHTKQLKKCVKDVETTTAALQDIDPQDERIPALIKAAQDVSAMSRVCVKSFQEEVDKLSKRSKAAENNYANLTAALAELPNPTTQLECATQQIDELSKSVAQLNQLLQEAQVNQENMKKELASATASSKKHSSLASKEKEELIQLRREVAEYEVEFRSLKNQDITIRKLETRIQELQSANEAELQKQLHRQQQELADTEGRRVTEALEREAAMERKCEQLELQLRAERAGRDAVHESLLQADDHVSQREAAWDAQRQILVDDANRLREQLHMAVKERDELRLRAEMVSTSVAPPSSGASGLADLMAERKAYEAEVAELSDTITLLRNDLKMKEESAAATQRQLLSKVEMLERERTTLQNQLTDVQRELENAPSQALVESMKRELRILKRLEYNADDVDAEPEVAGSDDGLETVLVSKLRHVESELVAERNNKKELAEQVEELEKSLQDAVSAKEEADKLVASLEQDLERAIMTQTPARSPKGVPSEPFYASEDPATLQSVLDPDAPPPPTTPQHVKTPKSTSEKANDDHSVATIVMAQRDRLRARCEALEAERDSFKKELQVQVQNAESLKSDNTKLYEKVRYLQNYGTKAPSSRQQALDRDLDLEALEQRYEASVDPFKQFSRTERQRKLNEMSPMERTVFIVAKSVLGTKEMRTALFFYVIAMHLLVFVTTYHWSHTQGDCSLDHEHLAHLPPALPNYMQQQQQQQQHDQQPPP